LRYTHSCSSLAKKYNKTTGLSQEKPEILR
jgi:hypothetical protein